MSKYLKIIKSEFKYKTKINNIKQKKSKKGHKYSYLKQNVATLSSTSLHQQQQQQQQQQQPMLNVRTITNEEKEDLIMSQRQRSTTSNVQRVSRMFSDYELVDRPLLKNPSPSMLSTTASISSPTNNLNNVLNSLQYGDVLIRCNLLDYSMK